MHTHKNPLNQQLIEAMMDTVAIDDCLERIGRLLALNADINYQQPVTFHNSIISFAIANEDIERVTRIIIQFSDKINFNLQDSEGKAPLLFAVKTIKLSLVSLILFYNKSSVNTPDHHGRTPLHFACLYGHEGMVRKLICHGANPLARNKNGKIPADYLSAPDNEIVATLTSVMIDARRHPLANSNTSSAQLFYSDDARKKAPHLIFAIYDPHQQLQGSDNTDARGILMCAENIFAILEELKEPKFQPVDPAYLSLLQAIEHSPSTLVETCLMGRSEVKKLLEPLTSAKECIARNELEKAFYYLKIAATLNKTTHNEYVSNAELVKLQTEASTALSNAKLFVYPDSASVINEFYKSSGFFNNPAAGGTISEIPLYATYRIHP